VISIEISVERKRIVECEAIVDTGASGGIIMPKALARAVGATLVETKLLPRTLDGREVHGKVTVVTVRVPQGNVGAETYAFCPDVGPGEVLVGSLFLGQVGAHLTIGDAEYEFPKPMKANARRGKQIDLSHWIINTDRPITPWW
jgi:predicted aspartyl protease